MKTKSVIRLAALAAGLLFLVWLAARSGPRPPVPPLGPDRHAANRQAAAALREVRRNWVPPAMAGADAGPAIRLRSGVLRPSAAEEPLVHARSSARGVPWLVLFDGPVQPAWREALEAAGAVLRAYLPDNAWLVEIPAAARGGVRRLPHVAWSGEYRPAHKLQPLLAGLARQNPDLPVPVTIQTFAPEDVAALVARLAAAGASDLRAIPARRWGLVRAVLPAGAAAELAALPEVQWIEHHEPPRILNDYARTAGRLAIDAVREEHGLDGAGQTVAIADTGLDTGDTNTLHPDFAGRLVQVFDIGRLTNWSDTYYHGTHVAGSVLGTGAASGGQFRGAAPGASLVFQSVMSASGYLALPDDLNELFQPPHAAGARVHSDSWGSAVEGEYTADSMTTDEFVWDHPDMLVVYAAGNEGTDYDRDGVVDPASLDSPASAKNALAIGAAESGRPAGGGGKTSRAYGSAWPLDFPANPIATDLISSSPGGAPPGLAAFSSRGPAADGRAKPDLVAPGTDIVSVRSRASSSTGWGLHANTNYCFMGGTSMATPLAAGAALLVRQYCVDVLGLAEPSAALLKAALVGGARSLSPGQYGEAEHREIPALPRPNSIEGFGMPDIAGTLFPTGGVQAVLLEGPALHTGGGTQIVIQVEGGAPLTAALAYGDYPSALAAAVNLVNDLDLLLVDPAGQPHHPNGLAGPDALNNVECIDVAAPAPGLWTLRVTATNVPQGPQPFALYLRGALRMPIRIDHAPLANSCVTNAGYLVEADVTSAGEFDPATVKLVWIATGGGGGFTTTPMATTNGIRFAATLPAQPLGAQIWYFIVAGPPEYPAAHPAGAPLQLHTFRIVPALALQVAGSPADFFASDPAYGAHVLPSNLALRARALYSFAGTNGWRTACVGWQGAGSVPATGATDFCDFTLAADSSLTWLWQEQVVLAHTSSPAGALNVATWHARDGVATSLVAPESHVFNSVPLTFAGWTVDGLRWPASPAPSPRQISGIPMPAPRLATATYLATALDGDANGLPDWFELRHYGALGQDRYADADGDGAEDELEAADHTDPHDDSSVPAPPVIGHVPLPAIASSPAPWTVSATVTDNYRVASATLHWRRNGGLLRSAAMTNVSGSTFSAALPSPARDGDVVAYHLAASDEAGFSTESATWTVTVAYARMSWSPGDLEAAIPAGTRSNVNLFVWNLGSRPLEVAFEIIPVGFADDVESGTNGWTRPDGNVDWHVSAQEASSPVQAWYCGQELSRTYRNSTHAALVSPPIQLGAGAPRLDFMHWARFEPDTDRFPDGVHYWDSGVLEVSDDDGLTWRSLVPEGGYPGLVTSNLASPFAPDTPCFVDTAGWEPVGADLAAYAGREIRLRFRFGADLYVVGEGWRLDDVAVSPRTVIGGWLAPPATNPPVPIGLGMIFPFALDASPLPPMGSDHLAILVHHNDPERGSPIVVPVALLNSTRRVRVTAEGSGQADPAGEVLVQADQAFAADFTADPGSFIADLRSNSVPLPLPAVVATQRLAWTTLPGNLDLHAVFAPTLPEGLVPPEWLAQFDLTTRHWMAEASLDPDGDGLLTWQEHELDSVPTNPADARLLVDFAARPEATGEWRLVWHAFTNRAASYAVLAASNLPAGFAAFTNLPAAPPVMTSPPLPPDSRFFGVRRN